MGLYKEVIHSDYQVYVWKIEEQEQELLDAVAIGTTSKQRLHSMSSQTHRKGFLAVRNLLLHAGYQDQDLVYSNCGRPSLVDGRYISISHSFEFATIIISDQNVGIDVEKKREKIRVIAPKFCNVVELSHCNNSDDTIGALTLVWCVKEAMFKMCESRSLSFKEHMNVEFKGTSSISTKDFERKFTYVTLDLGEFLLAYALCV